MLTLYHCNTSLASHKVRLYLAEKGIIWKGIHIDLRKQEHITSDYRKINPKGVVPSLIDEEGNIHLGSTEINEFIEKTHPKPPLLPENQPQRDLIHKICKQQEALHDPYIRTLSYHFLFMDKNNRKKLDVKRILKLAKHHPSPKRGEFMIKAIQGTFTKKEIASAKEAVIASLGDLESLLVKNQSGYLVGDHYSIADTVCTASVFRIEKVGMGGEIAKQEYLSMWWEAMRNRPSFKEAILDYSPNE